MTQAVYQWVRNLAVYYIVLTAAMNLMPSKQYAKYIRYFMGVLLVLILTSPLLGLLHLDEAMEAQFRQELLEEAFFSSQWGQLYGEGAESGYYMEAYEKEMESQMGEFLENILRGSCEIRRIQVELEQEEDSGGLCIASVQIVLAGAEDGRIRERVEHELGGTYEIPGEKVEVFFEKVG